MTQRTLTQDVNTEISGKVRFPTQEYDRKQFYESFTDVRYMLKINLVNGQQAEDAPIGIEDLIEFLGDVESIIENMDGISVQYRNHTHWTAKLNTGDKSMMESINWEKLEDNIETLAKEHGIALEKSVSMSGRGYDGTGMRCVGVNYSFGSYSEENRMIQNENNPLSKVNWVGGEIGDKEDLNPSTVQIKSVESVEPSLTSKIRRFLSSL